MWHKWTLSKLPSIQVLRQQIRGGVLVSADAGGWVQNYEKHADLILERFLSGVIAWAG